jgi:hypothetical protein
MLLCSRAYGAIDTAVVWEIRTGGAQTNGGGYKTGASGTDYSQQAAAQWSLVGMSAGGASPTITDANAAATMVGNVIYVAGGTNATTGWYEITSVNAGTDITVDRNWCTGACNNGTGNIGGAFDLSGSLDDDFFEQLQDGATVHIASGTYTLGETVNIANDGTAALPILIIGYGSARNDGPTGTSKPLINASATVSSGDYFHWSEMQFSASLASTWTFSCGTGNFLRNLYVENTSATQTQGALLLGASCTAIGCEGDSIGDTALDASSGTFIGCFARDSDKGFYCGASGNIIGCAALNCQTGIFIDGGHAVISNTTIRGCETGIYPAAQENVSAVNCIFADNINGIRTSGAVENVMLDYNVWYNNTYDVNNATKGANAINGNPGFASSVVEGSDGATDGAGTAFTAASNPFGSVTTDHRLVIGGTKSGATAGVYAISTVVGAGELTLATSAGASKTGIQYRIVLNDNITVSNRDVAANAAVNAGSYTDAVDDYTDVGGYQRAGAAGVSVNKSGNKQ